MAWSAGTNIMARLNMREMMLFSTIPIKSWLKEWEKCRSTWFTILFASWTCQIGTTFDQGKPRPPKKPTQEYLLQLVHLPLWLLETEKHPEEGWMDSLNGSTQRWQHHHNSNWQRKRCCHNQKAWLSPEQWKHYIFDDSKFKELKTT